MNIQLIYSLIAKSQTEEAIAIMKEEIAIESDLLLIESRLASLKRQERMGIISFSDASVQQAKIRESLLSLLQDYARKQKPATIETTIQVRTVAGSIAPNQQLFELFVKFVANMNKYVAQYEEGLSWYQSLKLWATTVFGEDEEILEIVDESRKIYVKCKNAQDWEGCSATLLELQQELGKIHLELTKKVVSKKDIAVAEGSTFEEMKDWIDELVKTKKLKKEEYTKLLEIHNGAVSKIVGRKRLREALAAL